MKKNARRSLFVSFVFLLALRSILPMPAQAIDPEDMKLEDMEIDSPYSAKPQSLDEEVEKQIEERFLKVLHRNHTDNDELDWAEFLWSVNRLEYRPENFCWNVMERQKNRDETIYCRALLLFQKYNLSHLRKKLLEQQALQEKIRQANLENALPSSR